MSSRASRACGFPLTMPRTDHRVLTNLAHFPAADAFVLVGGDERSGHLPASPGIVPSGGSLRRMQTICNRMENRRIALPSEIQ
jgi:hypothetical protein